MGDVHKGLWLKEILSQLTSEAIKEVVILREIAF